ncbi:MAG: hypothetical protein JW864_14345 [Spirochaetes bacterium]|nr:hypothetical protein [Spirochaetota bacterium]
MSALKAGFELVKKDKLLTSNHILSIQAELEKTARVSAYYREPNSRMNSQEYGKSVRKSAVTNTAFASPLNFIARILLIICFFIHILK